MTDLNYQNEIQQINELVQSGNFKKAVFEIRHLRAEGVPRETLLPLSNLARRSGEPLLALQLLRPLFRLDGRKIYDDVSSEEIVAYAASLSALGAYQDALSLFRESKAREFPDSYLQEGFCYHRQWDYRKSISCFEIYLKNIKLTDYQRLLAKTNLCSTYLFLDSQIKFLKMTKECLRLAESLNAILIKANIYEMQAEFYINQKKFDQAEDKLNKALALLGTDDSIYLYFVKKWQLILKLERQLSLSLDNKDIVEEIEEFKKISNQKGYWEVVRDCDFQVFLRLKDYNLFCKLWFGTPFESFRKRMIFKTKNELKIPDKWIENQNVETLDLHLGCYKGQKISSHLKHWQIIRILAKDRYKPTSLGVLFSQLYPNEVFAPNSSLKRIRQALLRLREDLKKLNIPLEINVKRNEFQIQTDLQIVYYKKEKKEFTKFTNFEERLYAGQFGHRFQMKNLAMEFSKSSVARIIEKGLRSGRIRRQAKGSSTCYFLDRFTRKKTAA